MTNGEILRGHADRIGIPLRTVEQARRALRRARKEGSDVIFAQVMFNHGRLNDEARAFVAKYLNDALSQTAFRS